AEAALASVSALAERAPRFTGWSLAAAATLAANGPVEVAIVGEPGPARDALEASALRILGAVVVSAPEPTGIPLLEGRTPVDGRPAAYVCRGFVCERPVTHPDEISA
ncbi:MAG TPA: N-acylglucosamine 2-epimerase, partial [Nocardioides sp.]|nr:N-acylglucosamine 2-epimerase [Nocardioides sp.]